MDFLQNFTAIPAFVVIIYLVAEIYKAFTKERCNEYIPVLCGVVGAFLSVIAFVFCPSFIGAETIFDAVAIGAVSGLSATGANQMFKQLK